MSKKEERKLRKFLKRQARIMDMTLMDLMIKEMKQDQRIHNKGVRLARKREKKGLGYIT